MEQKITALTAQKRNPNRVNVDLNGQFAFGLSRIVASWLKIGQTLSAEKIQELKNQDSEEIAYQKALQFISFKPRTTQQTIERLEKHGISQSLIETIIARLKKLEYLNDRRFAQNWVENRCLYKPRGSRLIQAELQKKGISTVLISEVVSEIDEKPLAVAAAQKRAPRWKTLPVFDFRKKMYAFLSRKGFSYDTVSEIIPQITQDFCLQASEENY